MPKKRSIFVILLYLLSIFTMLHAQNDYHYSFIPKQVYSNQLFPVTISGPQIASSIFFDASSDIQPIFTKPLIVKNSNKTFYTFYFKAANTDIELPELFITSASTDESIESKKIIHTPLSHDISSTGVLATHMIIKSQQVSNYDEENHIITLIIEAYEANLEDFNLKNVIEFGVDNLRRKNARVTAEIYVVLPRKEKQLHISYFNTVKKQSIFHTIPIAVTDTSVTTQSDLNPKIDAFERLKKYTILSFLIFFILMFLWKRDFFYLILVIITIVALLTFYLPYKKICVKQGAPLYILPTQISTIGTRIDYDINTPLLDQRAEFNKIEYTKGVIGWIKDEDICHN